MFIIALLALFIISLLLGLTLALQIIKFFNLCPFLLTSILLLQRESWGISMVLNTMAFILGLVLFISQLFQTLIGLEIPQTEVYLWVLGILGYNPITWSVKKQAMVSRSSTESEYWALTSTIVELCRLRQILKDLGIFISIAPKHWCDNIFALAIDSNPVFHTRTKHIEVDYHLVWERVLCHDLQVKYVSINDQLVDIFTKSLPSFHFNYLSSKILSTIMPKVLRGGGGDRRIVEETEEKQLVSQQL